LRDKQVKDRNLIDYLLRLLYSLCYEPKVCAKLQAEKISEGLSLRKPDFPNLCVQIQQKITNYQKNLGSAASASNSTQQQQQQSSALALATAMSEEEEPMMSTNIGGLSLATGGGAPTTTIQGGILKQSRYGAGQQSARNSM
jgi:hypothetical protein